jgi:hypothetical protein
MKVEIEVDKLVHLVNVYVRTLTYLDENAAKAMRAGLLNEFGIDVNAFDQAQAAK